MGINSKCQAPHIADLITGQFLPEQYKDIHELQGLITNLEQMTQGVPQAQRVFNEISQRVVMFSCTKFELSHMHQAICHNKSVSQFPLQSQRSMIPCLPSIIADCRNCHLEPLPSYWPSVLWRPTHVRHEHASHRTCHQVAASCPHTSCRKWMQR